jgi:hypothetical protein
MLQLAADAAGVIGALGIAGAVAAGVAYWLFKQFGTGWIKAQFDKDLEAFKASKNQELERLRAEISRFADRASRFHEKEYEVLPEAWGLLNKAHSAVGTSVMGFQQLPNLNGMSAEQLEEFLAETDVRESDRRSLRETQDRNRVYSKMETWRTLSEANNAQAAFNNYVILQGVFIENSIAEKMGEAAKLLRWAIVANRINLQGGGADLNNKMWTEYSKVEALVAEIKDDVKRRLWTIQLKDE